MNQLLIHVKMLIDGKTNPHFMWGLVVFSIFRESFPLKVLKKEINKSRVKKAVPINKLYLKKPAVEYPPT